MVLKLIIKLSACLMVVLIADIFLLPSHLYVHDRILISCLLGVTMICGMVSGESISEHRHKKEKAKFVAERLMHKPLDNSVLSSSQMNATALASQANNSKQLSGLSGLGIGHSISQGGLTASLLGQGNVSNLGKW